MFIGPTFSVTSQVTNEIKIAKFKKKKKKEDLNSLLIRGKVDTKAVKRLPCNFICPKWHQ